MNSISSQEIQERLRFENPWWKESGCAAAALKLKSMESGAGRFTDFILPPLTFHEYLTFADREGLIIEEAGKCRAAGINALNNEFVNYLNFGAVPKPCHPPRFKMTQGDLCVAT